MEPFDATMKTALGQLKLFVVPIEKIIDAGCQGWKKDLGWRKHEFDPRRILNVLKTSPREPVGRALARHLDGVEDDSEYAEKDSKSQSLRAYAHLINFLSNRDFHYDELDELHETYLVCYAVKRILTLFGLDHQDGASRSQQRSIALAAQIVSSAHESLPESVRDEIRRILRQEGGITATVRRIGELFADCTESQQVVKVEDAVADLQKTATRQISSQEGGRFSNVQIMVQVGGSSAVVNVTEVKPAPGEHYVVMHGATALTDPPVSAWSIPIFSSDRGREIMNRFADRCRKEFGECIEIIYSLFLKEDSRQMAYLLCHPEWNPPSPKNLPEAIVGRLPHKFPQVSVLNEPSGSRTADSIPDSYFDQRSEPRWEMERAKHSELGEDVFQFIVPDGSKGCFILRYLSKATGRPYNETYFEVSTPSLFGQIRSEAKRLIESSGARMLSRKTFYHDGSKVMEDKRSPEERLLSRRSKLRK